MQKPNSSQKRAVALRYDTKQEGAPRVVSKADKHLVEKLLELAKRHDIVVYEDGDLLEALYALPVGYEVSPELYGAVAEVIAYCYKINQTKV